MSSLWELYNKYWTKSKRELVIIPVMNAKDLTPTILKYSTHPASMIKAVKKETDENDWSLDATQDEFKTRNKEI